MGKPGDDPGYTPPRMTAPPENVTLADVVADMRKQAARFKAMDGVCRHEARALNEYADRLEAIHPTAGVGMVVVPVEPTEAMRRAGAAALLFCGDSAGDDVAATYAAMLAAAPTAAPPRSEAVGDEPIGWVYQHEETGRMTFCENDGINTPEVFQRLNPRHVLCGPAYTHSPPPALLEWQADVLSRAEFAFRSLDSDHWMLAQDVAKLHRSLTTANAASEGKAKTPRELDEAMTSTKVDGSYQPIQPRKST